MSNAAKKPQPNDKQLLLDAEGYEIYNRELMRRYSRE